MISFIIYFVLISIIHKVSLQQCPQIPANSTKVVLNSVVYSGTTIPGFETFDEDAISYSYTYIHSATQMNTTATDSFKFRDVTSISCGPAYTCCFALSGFPIIPNTAEEKNWLVSDYYMTDAQVIQVQISCGVISSYSVPDCRNTSRVYYYESDSAVVIDPAVLSNLSLASNSINQAINDELILASFSKTKKGFYIGIMNNGYCVQISTVQIFYSICPSININQLNSLPETPVPRESEEPTVFNVSCPVGSVSLQQAECYSNGSWRVPECVCERGWSEVTSNLSCVACPENTYKSAIGNDSECVTCPEMSSTNGGTGSVLCGCDGGWYRSEEESVDMLCGRSPSVVRNIRLERGTTGSSEEIRTIRVVWDEPVDVWNRSVSYNVSLYSDGLWWWWSGRSESLWYELSESELGESSREYLLLVTSLNELVVLSGVENSVSVSFVSTFPDVVNVSLRLIESSSVLEWEYKLEGGVSELSFELNYTSIGGVMRQERVNGCSLVSTAVYRCNVTVIELNTSIDIVLTLFPLSTIETGDRLSTRFNLPPIRVQSISSTSSTPEYSTTYETLTSPAKIPLINQTVIISLILFSSLFLTIIVITCCILFICCLLTKKHIRRTWHIFPRAYKTAKYAVVDDASDKTRISSYQDPDMFANLRDAVRHFAKEINNNDIKIDHVIGNGEFGDVCKGTLNQDGHLFEVALKTLKPDVPEKHKLDFYREASIMGQFDNENIIRLLGVTLQHPVMIITPFMSNGSLDVFLQNRQQDISLEKQGKLALGVASGMVYLSSISFVHRDLAARNVLVAHDMTPKIIDFGLSRETEEDVYTMSKGGLVAVRWTAIESILYKRFNSASDVWSFGVLLWEIMSFGAMPYEEIELIPLVKRLEDGYRMPLPDKCPEQIYQLMSSCWLHDPNQRPNFFQVHMSLKKLIESHFRNEKTDKLAVSYQANQPCYSSVRDWLASIEMDRYEDNFTDNDYLLLNTVWLLNQSDLLRIGIIPAKHRNKIMTSIRKANQLIEQYKRAEETTRV